MAQRLTLYILIGMVLGIVAGLAMHAAVAEPALSLWAGYLTIPTDLFLRLIKMIIAPLVFSTLVVGIAHMGDTSALGRIGARTLGWFLGATLVSLTLGLIMVNLLQPGAHTGLALPPTGEGMGLDAKGFNLHDFFVHIVPASITEAMANNDILPIVVFSVFMGVALVAVGEKGKPLVAGIEALVAVMLKITDYVMRVAPIAVFAAIAHAVAINGAGILLTFGRFVGSFYLTLGVLWAVLIGAGFVMLGGRARSLVRLIREPTLLAFSTASSEAAYPRLLEALEVFGVPRRIASFVLPLGYSFNLDGSMIYMTFATLFIAQAYGIDISIGQQILMVLILMVTSKGMAGVPRASLVVIAAVMGHFHIPEAGLLLVLAVDQFLDMGRSGTNVIGNAVATAVVAKWEGALTPPRERLDLDTQA
ncbi:dicarboxylate/amino acid:cation symporter [Sphingomonas sp. PR090111-T3T-6A]|uniref:dicarboxylate/amino acid:cation symporter n=1 Tax=Sphingomonas sp. PR090111-T3T-6A TaxID=685778 RepID=UPI00037CDDD4|nr:dicarboxylate/amino acid:cation symporter [Sphingomonas sp. PR090111-T3T-6A]